VASQPAEKGERVKKRDKQLQLSRETVMNLIASEVDLVAVAGGSCTSGKSTAGDTVKVCCIPP
jgi:hypothetical protein